MSTTINHLYLAEDYRRIEREKVVNAIQIEITDTEQALARALKIVRSLSSKHSRQCVLLDMIDKRQNDNINDISKLSDLAHRLITRICGRSVHNRMLEVSQRELSFIDSNKGN